MDLLESKTKEFIASLAGSPPIYTLPPKEAREVLNKVQSDESYKSMVDMQDVDQFAPLISLRSANKFATPSEQLTKSSETASLRAERSEIAEAIGDVCA